jgi:signal transduction histidine kinase
MDTELDVASPAPLPERRDETTDLDGDQFATRLASPNGLQLVVEIVHDLRSPLTAILFLSEALQQGGSGPVTGPQRQQLGIIYTAALGLISLASDVIELAQGGELLAETELTNLSLEQVLTSVHDVARPMAEEKSLEMRLVIEGADQRIGHPVALSRVLLNLATNALKFTSHGSVELSAKAVGPEHVRFTVVDTGDGFDDETLKYLYEPFPPRRSRRTTTFSGSGLGLAICRKLVDAMGSQLVVQTSPGQGTTFSFELHLPPAPNPA